MRLNKKLIWGTAALAGVLLAPSIFRNTETYSTECETYQGHRRNKADGEIIYIFDPQTLEQRGIRPSLYSLSGEPEWTKQLKMGRQYRLQVKGGNHGELVSFQQCADSEISRTESSE